MASTGKTWNLSAETRARQSAAQKVRGAAEFQQPEVRARAAETRRRNQAALRAAAPRCGTPGCDRNVTLGRGGWFESTSPWCRIHKSMDERARSYGTTLQSVCERWQQVNGKCEACGKQLLFTAASNPERADSMHMDHDHATGRFRGLLCRRCNSVLGYVEDDASRLRKLADYVERHNGG